MWRRWKDRVMFMAGAVLIAVYFFRLVRPTLHLYFSSDDLMNLYRAWEFRASDLVKANLLFFLQSDFYRPLASAWYRIIFHFAGLNAFPFHLANMAILAGNVVLTYAVVRRLTESRAIGAVAALLISYHHRFDCLYFDTAYIFDVLCYFFYFLAVWIWLRWRGDGLKAAAALCVPYICALNSKEIAVTLPVALVLYEWLFQPVKLRRLKPIALPVAVTLMFLIGRMTGPAALISNPGYRPLLTWGRFMETSRNFLGDVFSGGFEWRNASVLALCGALLLIAWLAHSRTLRFAWLFLMLTPLPVAFIYPRGAAQYYIPWFGYVLFASVVMVRAAERVKLPSALLLVGLAALLYPYFKRAGFPNVTSVTVEGPQNKQNVEQLLAVEPHPRPHSHLLFLNDPIRPDWDNLIFIVRLTYQDRTLEIDRAKKMPQAPDPQKYDYVFDYRDDRFVELKRP